MSGWPEPRAVAAAVAALALSAAAVMIAWTGAPPALRAVGLPVAALAFGVAAGWAWRRATHGGAAAALPLSRDEEDREALLRIFFDHADLMRGIVELDGERVVHRIRNAQAEALFDGEPASGVDGLSPDALELWRHRLRQCQRQGRCVVFDFVIERGGEERTLAATLTPLPPAESTPPRFAYVIEDMTAQRRDEREMERAREQADSSNRAKSEFLATMSHEIRTPMNGVVGMATLLADTELDSIQREYVQTISNSADALLTILNDILDVSKIEAGRMEFEHAPFSVADLAEEVVDLMQARAAEKGLELAFRLHPRTPVRLVGDAGRVRQILLNLVGNAVKFTDRGGVTVEIRGQQMGLEDTELRISVRDTGIGITPEQQARLFQPFTQVDGSFTRRHGGTGLGLVICRRLAEQMGGEMGLDSREGEGSTFWFTLRLPVDPTAAGHAPECADLQGARILVAGSRAETREAVRDRLEDWGARIDEVAGIEAVRRRLRGAEEAGDPVRLMVLIEPLEGAEGRALLAAVLPQDTARPSVLALRRTPPAEPLAELAAAGLSSWLPRPARASALAHAIQALLGRETPVSRVLTRDLLGPIAARRSGEGSRPFLGRRVLLAEDNATNQKVAVRMLEKLGCEVIPAGDGLAAVEAFREGSFDAVLMDCQMPRMDGYGATQAIRAIEERTGGRVPVIALTANAMQGDRERCLEAGMDDFVSKPIQHARLLEALERWLGPAEGEREAA